MVRPAGEPASERSVILARISLAKGVWAAGLLVLMAAGCSGSSLADFDGATFYKAPLGSRVRIACNGSYWRDDSVSLVLWFKGTLDGRHSAPIYTVDARQRPLDGGARHLVADAYKGRAKFVTKASPPYLDLSPLEADDQSEYRCRIDYRTRPRENFLVILFVIVPPKSVQIVDSNGRSLEHIYGPLSEGQHLTLMCLSKGGRPAPSVIWRRRQRVIDDSYLTLADYLALRRLQQLDNSSKPDGQRRPPSDDSNDNVLPLNSINPANSVQPHEWPHWPEFHYFSRQLLVVQNNTAPNNKSSPQIVGRKDKKARRRQLLRLSVAESIITAVNVLRLPSLERNLLADWQQPQQHQVNEEPQVASKQLASLECQASNLHYDLRTLIKLFAPASLLDRSLQVESDGDGEDGEPAEEPAEPADETQLVEAIERALESQLSQQTASASAAATLLAATAALRQQQNQPDAANVGQVQLVDRPLLTGEQPADKHTLLYQQLQRGHQLAQLRGQDNGNNQSVEQVDQQQELVRSRLIALDVLLRPSDVHIADCAQRRLSAGQLSEFTCLASGARPAALLSWFKNGRPLESSRWRQFSEPVANTSQSKLALEVQRQDNGAQLSCRATNEPLANLLVGSGSSETGSASLEDTCTLTVHYAPVLKLELGYKIPSSQVREGGDIYFVCQVEAMPAIKELTWLHNGRPLNESSPGGLIMSNNSLVLQRVRLEQRGQYSCMASNGEGVTESNQIELRVLHAPICIGNSQAKQQSSGELLVASRALSLQSWAKFRCQMLADPADGLQFSWFLNTSGANPGEQRQLRPDEDKANRKDQSSGDKRQDHKAAHLAQTSSQLSYLVETNADYGRLYCLARNSIGQQKRACVYEIRPPEAHELPSLSCSALNASSAAVWIACSRVGESPAAGQTEQPFRFQVQLLRHTDLEAADYEPDEEEGQLESRLVSADLERPAFALRNLQPDTSYSALVSQLDAFTRQPSQNGRPALIRFTTKGRQPEERAVDHQGTSTEPILIEPIGQLAPSARSSPTKAIGNNNPRQQMQVRHRGWLASLGSFFGHLVPQTAPSLESEEQLKLQQLSPTTQQQAMAGLSQRHLLEQSSLVWTATLSLLLLASLLLLFLFQKRRRQRLQASAAQVSGFSKPKLPLEIIDKERRCNSSAGLTSSETDQSRVTCTTLTNGVGHLRGFIEQVSPGAGWDAASDAAETGHRRRSSLFGHAPRPSRVTNTLDSRRRTVCKLNPISVSESRSSLCLEPLWLAEQQQSGNPDRLIQLGSDIERPVRLISDANSLEASDPLKRSELKQQNKPTNFSHQLAIEQLGRANADDFEEQLQQPQLPALIMTSAGQCDHYQYQSSLTNYVLSSAASQPNQVAFAGQQLLAETMLAPSSTMLRCQQPPADKLAAGRRPAGLLQLNKPSFVIADCHSLVSDESSDSNAHYTWSIATTATPTTNNNLFEQQQPATNQPHYIELAAGSEETTKKSTCQDPSNWTHTSFCNSNSCNLDCESAYTTIKRNGQYLPASILKNSNKYQS